MYVRDARNRDEAWLLDQIEAMGLDETGFRSRDYVLAVDEAGDERAGFGRVRVLEGGDDDPDGVREVCELTSIGVLAAWRGQGVGAHVVERLVQTAGDQGFEEVYALTDQPEYLAQFGFEPVETDRLPGPLGERLRRKRDTVAPAATPVRLVVERFRMPPRLRRRFKNATPATDGEDEPDAEAEDFGIDPDEATYKYDTGD